MHYLVETSVFMVRNIIESFHVDAISVAVVILLNQQEPDGREYDTNINENKIVMNLTDNFEGNGFNPLV